MIFHESREFMIELVTTTAEGENDSSVETLYTSIDNNTILLQVVREKRDVLKCLFIYLLIYLSIHLFIDEPAQGDKQSCENVLSTLKSNNPHF